MKNLGISDGCKIWNFDVKDIELTETFKCTGQELYNALTQKEMLQIFTGGEVKVIINCIVKACCKILSFSSRMLAAPSSLINV